ncbi:MAG: Mur ligase family protein, partial [Glaciecola sp.]
MLAALLTSLGVPSAAIGQRIETPKGIYSRDDVPSGEYGLLQYVRHLANQQPLQVVAIEVYSAALAKGLHHLVNYDYIAFTNITDDHLNVHGSMQAYEQAKARLLNRLCEKGNMFVHPNPIGLTGILEQAGNQGIKVNQVKPCQTPFTLLFQQQNCALAKALAQHILKLPTFAHLPAISEALLHSKVMKLYSPPGRCERWELPNGVTVFIDFAHNSGGITTVIEHAKASLPVQAKVGFLLSSKGGWGRDKRMLMANAAAAADIVIVTDDDPRTEDPAVIRMQLAYTHRYSQITPRSHAISTLCARLQAGDIAIIAGRGADDRWQDAAGRFRYNDIDVIKAMGGQKH